MATVFFHYNNKQFSDIIEAHLTVYGHTVVKSPPADVVVIDLDYLSPPKESGNKFTVLISGYDEYIWDGKLPPHDIYLQRPVDAWFLLDTIEEALKQKS